MESLLIPYAVSDVPEVRAILALAPHPDDEVFGCGGALALHVAAGARVQVVVVTGGHMAGDAATREAESRAAARLLGYAEPQFWGLPDRGVQYGEALVQRIIDTLVELKAQVLYAPSLWENHPDHRTVALAALEAARRHGDCTLMAYEVGAPLRPNLLVDITPVLAQKRAAMASFVSQLALQRYDRHIEALNVFRTYTLGAAVQAAEAYERMDAQALRMGIWPFLGSEYGRQQTRGLVALPSDMPLVSVLIRSMDRVELDRALDSVAVQTWPRIEVVVVNAKGPGHRPLPAWCGRFPLRFVDRAMPLQRSVAANQALDHAEGDALLLLDDDDWLDADHVHKLVKALEAQPEAVAATTGARGLDAEGGVLHEWTGELASYRLLLANQVPIMCVLFRRSSLAGVVRFDEQLEVFEDWDFWLQLGQQGVFGHAPGVSANYLIRTVGGSGVHGGEASRDGRAKIRAKWRTRWPDGWLDALQEEFDDRTQRVSRLNEELAAVHHANHELAQNVEVSEQGRSAAERQRDQVSQALVVEQQQHEASREGSHKEVLRLLGRCDAAAMELAQVREELEARVYELEAQGHMLEAHGRELQAQAEQQRQMFLSSTSWRVTAPLRRMMRVLRGR